MECIGKLVYMSTQGIMVYDPLNHEKSLLSENFSQKIEVHYGNICLFNYPDTLKTLFKYKGPDASKNTDNNLLFNISSDHIEKKSKISVGASHCIILDENGTVFGCGENNYGQCSMDKKYADEFIEYHGIPKIKDVMTGYFHTILVDYENNLWVMGHNSHGQLGTGDTDNVRVAKKIQGLKIENIKFGKGSQRDTVILCEDGNVYITFNKRFEKVQNITFIIDIACGRSDIYLLDIDGNVLKFSHEQHDITKIPELCNIIQLFSDDDDNSYFLDKNMTVYYAHYNHIVKTSIDDCLFLPGHDMITRPLKNARKN